MREFNLLKDYPKPKVIRKVKKNLRNINSRIVASYREKEFYDGSRNNGYGGFRYDGRWKPIVKFICHKYNLNNKSSILQLGSEKGFFLQDFKEYLPKAKIMGLEKSSYAIKKCSSKIKKFVRKSDYTKLNFSKNAFDFVLAIGVVYSLTLEEAIKSIKEIQRVSKGKSFINLASYKNEKDYWLFKNWTVLGSLILKKKEWLKVLKHCKYSGDFYFTNAKTLNLKKS